MAIITRPMSDKDFPYVVDSFLHGFRGEPWAQGCSNDFLTGTMAKLLAGWTGWACTILCDHDTLSEILGYVVWKSPQEIAWICVKRAVQNNGFAHRLLSDIGTDTGLPIRCAFLSKDVQRGRVVMLFRPYLAFQ